MKKIEDLSIIGEVADDETARKFIEMTKKVPNPILPKMSLKTYMNISKAIDEELNKFALKWHSRIDNLSYNEIFGLLQAEPEKYSIITKYNCVERAKNRIELLNGLCNEITSQAVNEAVEDLVKKYGHIEETWNQKKFALWQFMIPYRYTTEEKD